jgi:hypothetical protein
MSWLLVRALLVVVLLATGGALSGGKNLSPGAGGVRLELLSIDPITTDEKELDFRIKLRLRNESGRPIFVESFGMGRRLPYFVRYEKRIHYGPGWLHVWPFFDAPPDGLHEIKPGESLEFEDTIQSVSAYLMHRGDGIPIRGVHRARLPYYYSRKDGELARFVGTARKAKVFWAVSEPFRIDWPPEAQWPSGMMTTPKP